MYSPRGVGHSFRVDSSEARLLLFFGPAGVENFFREIATPARELTQPPGTSQFPAGSRSSRSWLATGRPYSARPCRRRGSRGAVRVLVTFGWTVSNRAQRRRFLSPLLAVLRRGPSRYERSWMMSRPATPSCVAARRRTGWPSNRVGASSSVRNQPIMARRESSRYAPCQAPSQGAESGSRNPESDSRSTMNRKVNYTTTPL
jgi:hypothetical protein